MVKDQQCEEEAELMVLNRIGKREESGRKEKNQVGKRGWREVAGNGMERCAKHTTHSLVLSHISSFLLLLPPSLTYLLYNFWRQDFEKKAAGYIKIFYSVYGHVLGGDTKNLDSHSRIKCLHDEGETSRGRKRDDEFKKEWRG